MAPSLFDRLRSLATSRASKTQSDDPGEGAVSSPAAVTAGPDPSIATSAEPTTAQREPMDPVVEGLVVSAASAEATAARPVARRAKYASDEPVASASTTSALVQSVSNHRFLGVVVGIAAIGLALAFLRDMASLIAPIFLALNLMITVYPIHRQLVKWKIPSWLAAIAAGLVVFVVLVAFLTGLSYAIAEMVTYLPRYQSQFSSLINQLLVFAEQHNFSQEQLIAQAKQGLSPDNLISIGTSVLSETQGAASLMLVVVTVLIFMTMDAAGFENRLHIGRKTHGVFIDALEHFARGIRKYWVVTTAFGLIVAVLDLAVLIGLAVPLPLVWALFSFLTNYIPNIGFVIGVLPPALLALFEHGPKTAIAVVIAYSVLNFVVQSIIQPKFAGDAVGLSPTLSFISLLLWTSILGALGALLALPCSLLVKALLIDADPKSKWVNSLISSRPEDGIDIPPDGPSDDPVDVDGPPDRRVVA